MRNRTSYPLRAPALQAGSDPTRSAGMVETDRNRTGIARVQGGRSPVELRPRMILVDPGGPAPPSPDCEPGALLVERWARMVMEPRGVAPRLRGCHPRVILFHHGPLAQPPRIELGPAGLQPAVQPLTLELRSVGSPAAIRTQISRVRAWRATGYTTGEWHRRRELHPLEPT